ncbi:MAG: hypothetical protein PHE67_02525 [Campylobacterales bacterium]|nr:hypothetical protein [Campylobacterales bacterium]
MLKLGKPNAIYIGGGQEFFLFLSTVAKCRKTKKQQRAEMRQRLQEWLKK